MRGQRNDIQATRPVSRLQHAVGSQVEKSIAPWEQPGYFRLDCESHRGTLLVQLAFPTFFPCFGSFFFLMGFFLEFGCYYPLMGVLGYISGDSFHNWCLPSLIFSVCGIALALPAWVMATHDLVKMRKGLMDPSGKVATAGAWYLSRLGLKVNGCVATFCVLILCLRMICAF